MMRAFFCSFGYAAKGLQVAVKEERNLRFHLAAAFYVYLFSLFYPFGKGEYVLLTLCVAGVLSVELLNSAIERCVHAPSPERYQMAGVVKDIAAAAVLVICIGAVACGILLFWDVAVFEKIVRFFADNPWWLLALAASLALWFWFVFLFGRRKEKP